MKFNRKGKTVFAIALTACMAGMAFSALPLLSVQAVEECEELKCTEHKQCDKNGFNKEGPCKTYTFEATEETTWQDLEDAAKQVTCTGWTFDGWYTKELEYSYWGDKCDVFGCSEENVLYPHKGWECALEFAEYYTDNNGEFNVEGVKSNYTDTIYYYKELFNRWLTRFKDDCKVVEMEELQSQEEKDPAVKIITETEKKIKNYKVTSDNFNCKVKKACEECKEKEDKITLYARMKPQKVQIQLLSDKTPEQEEKDKARANLPGVIYGNKYLTIYRQYGSPLGDLPKNIGERQYGRTLIGWRKVGTETAISEELDNEIDTVDGIWMPKPGTMIKYWWAPTALTEKFVEKTDGDEIDRDNVTYQWTLEVKAIYEGEDVHEKAVQEMKVKAMGMNSMPLPSVDEEVEQEHVCGNGTLIFKEATCQEKGVKAHFQCSCGKDYWDQGCTKPVEDGTDFTTEMHHNLIKIQGKKATCTEAGKADRWVCNTCHKNFTDEKGEHEASDFTIEALGHEYKDQGNGRQICTRCGDVIESEKTVEPEVKPQEQPQVQPQAQEQPTIEETKKEEAPKTETKQEVKEEVKKEEVKKETKPEPKQETTAPQTPVAPEKDEEEEKDEVVVEREQQTRPSSRRSARA